jgi:subtilisin family serine protease
MPWGLVPCRAFDLVVGPTINGWTLSWGTSAAAPHVAGVAALVIGAHGGEMDPDAVEAILRNSADDLGKPGVDDYYGHGRVNAAKAVGLK